MHSRTIDWKADQKYRDIREKMSRIIETEAGEKADMIIDKAKQKMERERNKAYNLQRDKALQELKEKEENDKIQKRLDKSRKINEIRLNIQSHRNSLLEDLKGIIQKKLQETIKNKDQYKELLIKLALQGLIRLIEKDVNMVVMKEDVALAKEIIPKINEQYQAVMNEHIVKDFELNL